MIARRKRDLGDHVTVATLDAFPFTFGPREFEHGGWHDLCGEEEDKDYGEVGRSLARSTGDSLVTHLVCVLRRDPADATWADATDTEVARWRRHQERFVWVGETITPRTGWPGRDAARDIRVPFRIVCLAHRSCSCSCGRDAR